MRTLGQSGHTRTQWSVSLSASCLQVAKVRARRVCGGQEEVAVRVRFVIGSSHWATSSVGWNYSPGFQEK